jgi:hypothetical protein
MNSWPYAVAIAITAALSWDVWRRWFAIQTKQLAVVHEFQAIKRDFDLLDVKTRKAIETITSKVNESIIDLQNKLEAEELKRGMQQNRRFG